MFHRVVLAIFVAASMASMGCGGAGLSSPAAESPPAVGPQVPTVAPAAGDGDLTLTTEPTTSPAELREQMAERPPRVPIAQLPAPGPEPPPPLAAAAMETPAPGTRSGEPHAAPPAVSSDPVGDHLITTLFEVDSAGDMRLRYAR